MIIFDESMKFWKGNTHMHTTESDGKLSTEEAADVYRRQGYDFVVQTEPSTCKKHGTKTTTCADSACTYSKVEKLPLGEHDYPAEPNVVQGDFAYYVCADCGKIIIKSTNGTPIVPIG